MIACARHPQSYRWRCAPLSDSMSGKEANGARWVPGFALTVLDGHRTRASAPPLGPPRGIECSTSEHA